MNTTKKPIREWLDEIPDETIRKQAIENWEDYKAEDKKKPIITTLYTPTSVIIILLAIRVIAP